MREIKYAPSILGLGTESSQDSQPSEYALKYQNRFRNYYGKAEKRQGLIQDGNTLTGQPALNALHEWVNPLTQVKTLFTSSNGTIYRKNDSTGDWDQVLTGKANVRLLSVQMQDKLIFVNGIDRNFYTNDGGDSFEELKALILKGELAGGSNTTTVIDGNVNDWTAETLVALNDVIYNATRDAYGIVTSVGASNLSITEIGTGSTGSGQTSGNQTSGDEYQLIDTVELNIIPNAVGTDNVAIATTGTSAQGIAVSALDFSTTEIRAGDFIRNTTRSALTQVVSVGSTLTVASVAGQTSGDSLVFQKSAMPIANYPHIHYGYIYFIDSRDTTKIRVGGPDDPEDFTTFQKTLQSTTLDFGSKQPKADNLLALSTFQRFLVAAGTQGTYADDGQTPISVTTAASTDLEPVGLFPQGCVARFGLQSIGNDMLYVAQDGLRQFKAASDSRTTSTFNITESIKSEVISLIKSKIDSIDDIQLIHYPKRNWVMMKLGSVIYNYNYTPIYKNGQVTSIGSWSKFTGQFAEQNAYFISSDGDLLTCGDEGKVYKFDQGNYDDDGSSIQTIYQTSFLNLTDPDQPPRVIDTRYIRPTFETTTEIVYTIDGEGGYDIISTDQIITTARAAGVVGKGVVGKSVIGGFLTENPKLPFRLRGQQIRLTITTDDTNGPDIISDYTLYGNIFGRD